MQKESSFNPDAISWTGAGIGLMQVNPNIWLSVYNVTREELFNPWLNIKIGVQILHDYVTKYGTSGGLGAYFAGPNNRLSASAQSYARTVLGFYSNLIAKVRGVFTTSVPKPGEFWFVEPQPGSTPSELIETVAFDVLPEEGEIQDLTSIPKEAGLSDSSWAMMIVGGLALLLWQQNR